MVVFDKLSQNSPALHFKEIRPLVAVLLLV